MHPVLLEIGKFKIYSYGTMMVLGYIAVVIYVMNYASRIKVDKYDALDMSLISFVSGIIGSRVLYVLINIKKYVNNWASVLDFSKGGLTWYGGFLGGVIGLYIFARRKKMAVGDLMDLGSSASIVGLAIGRMGCFLNGCCYGKPTNLPWAVNFPHSVYHVPVHPTQIYEMILDFSIFAFLVNQWKWRKFPFEISLTTFSLYAFVRFIVEFFRYNTPEQMIYGLSLAQWVSLVIFLIFGVSVLLIRAKTPYPVDAQESEITPDSPSPDEN